MFPFDIFQAEFIFAKALVMIIRKRFDGFWKAHIDWAQLVHGFAANGLLPLSVLGPRILYRLHLPGPTVRGRQDRVMYIGLHLDGPTLTGFTGRCYDPRGLPSPARDLLKSR